ncbi:MAG: [protein-PII] uridylyltransferase [bacterium]|nr:[protein-PII] uridylyltransferase [bacterium]
MTALLPALDSEIAKIHAHYKDELQTIRLLHESNEDPRDIVREITNATDTMVIRLLSVHLHQSLQQGEMPPNLLLLAQGGYGRREMHPHSDIDILFLYQHSLKKEENELVKVFFRTLFDLGFQVGHCCRSFREALDMAYNDPHSQSALSESRFLAGDWRLFEEFKDMLWRNSRRYRTEYIRGKIRERDKRHKRYGDTINITEPHIKESPGGLRDYHFGLWLGSLLSGHTVKLVHMKRAGIIEEELINRVDQSLIFLWRLRTDLHFLTGKEQDVLALPIQHEVSTRLGYQDRNGRLSEEEMMRDYYTHASTLREFADRMTQRCRPKPFWVRWLPMAKRPLSDGFFIQEHEIQIPPNLHFFEHNPQRLLMAFIHSAVHHCNLSVETLRGVRDNLDLIDQAFRHDRQNAGLLQRYFSLPVSIHESLAAMRETGVLERIFPEWKGIAYLVRYDLAHKFTVDEHSLLCLKNLETLDEDPHSFHRERAQLWRECKNRAVLRLAVLLHDVGKGTEEDHSIRGARLAGDIGRRIRLPEKQFNQLAFLIRNHLLMSHIAQHRDMSDPDVTADFCDAFDSQEELDMMYLLSYVDIQSVSKDSMTEWKNNLLWQLYLAARDVFVSDAPTKEERQARALTRKEALIRDLSKTFNSLDVQEHLNRLPPSYLLHQSRETIEHHLALIARFDGTKPVVTISPHVDPTCRNMAIVCRDKVGLFNRICTAIMLENFSIIEANLNTRTDGLVANNIVVSDEIGGEIAEMREKLLTDRVAALIVKEGELPKLPASSKKTVLGRSSFKNRVKILNDASARFTILEMHCVDQRGLLQKTTSVISSMNMNIDFARIVTQGNRVIDVFYITDSAGDKISGSEALDSLKSSLEAMLNSDNPS